MNKIAFVITTFLRDDLLFEVVESLIPFQKENWHIIIVDQGNESKKKTEWLKAIQFTRPDLIHYYKIPFDSGLSYARNIGVVMAKEYECDYTVISSDSFKYNNTIEYLDCIVKKMHFNKRFNKDLIGFELENCKCGWEAKLNLIEGKCFELNFIEKEENKPGEIIFHSCDIVRNFFVATTESLLNTQWDKNLKLGEHEDYFWRYKQNNYRVAWTNGIVAEKLTHRPIEYAKFRSNHFREGKRYLREKYNIKGWVSYKNLNRAKKRP